jgi:RNA polymerase sigma factor (TIGR02999 family)
MDMLANKEVRPPQATPSEALVRTGLSKGVTELLADWRGWRPGGAGQADPAQFFAVAAQLMRRILVDYARSHRASKRGGNYRKLSLIEGAILVEDRNPDLTELDEMLDRFATIDPQQGRVVELRIFGGLTVEETAEVMGISSRTVKREWRMARAWRHQQIKRTRTTDE